MRASFSSSVLLILVSSFTSSLAFATDAIPNCMDQGNVLPINNPQVLVWKTTTANKWQVQTHVEGNVATVYPDRNGHGHFSIQIGPNRTDTLEVVYNQDFGSIPAIRVGEKVEACGVYITSIAADEFPKSPDGAIIHWVHRNPKGRGHDDGYLAIDGILYGQGDGNSHGNGNNNGGRNGQRLDIQPGRRNGNPPNGNPNGRGSNNRHGNPAPRHH
ncbi:MAG: DUF3465 domain-containing protein [Methylotenera sp.]|nr:DUF3465 domain-containing protein [Oligoflexia bacterium]